MSEVGPSRRRVPQQDRSRDVVRRTLDAALRLVVDHGITAITVRAAADEVGVSPAALYQFFANREAIVRALLDRELADRDTRFEELLARSTPPPDLPTAVAAFLAFHREQYLDQPEMVALYYSARAVGTAHDTVQAHLDRLTDDLHEYLTASGLLPAGTRRLAVEMAVELGDHVFSLAHRRPDDAEDVIAEGHRAVLQFLRFHADPPA